MRLYRPTYVHKKTGQRKVCETWRVRWSVAGRKFDETTRCRDRRAAEQVAARLVRESELEAAGLQTHFKTRDLPVAKLIDDYAAELARRGRSKKHVAETPGRLRALFEAGGIGSLVKATPAALRLAFDRLTTRKKRRCSPRTIAHYRTAAVGFFRWLQREGKWSQDPTEQVTAPSAPEPTFQRRALTPHELAKLIGTAPAERALVYRFAATTGLRRGELEHLTVPDVNPEEGVVRVRASVAKSRAEQVVPLPREVAEVWTAWRREHRPTDSGGKALPPVPAVDVLRDDLRAAGIEPETAEGKIDFHSLRVTFGTSLARAGVPLAVTQRLMRHSTPLLTTKHYTRLEIFDLAAAAEKAAQLSPVLTPRGVIPSQQPASPRSENAGDKAAESPRGARESRPARGKRHGSGRRTRTVDLRVMNPVL